MEYSVYKISLDIHKPEAQELLEMKFLDSKRRIQISLTENGKVYQITPDCKAMFSAKKSDGNKIYNQCEIVDNTIIYDVTQQTLACLGAVDCEVQLLGSDEAVITSSRFIIIVHDRVYNGEEIVDSAPEFDALQDRIDKADKLYDKVNNAYENGDLKGEKGEKGDNGADGAKGQDGADGISAMHSWNGTTLTITSASGTSSANLKGDKGDKGDKGEDGAFSDELADEITLNTAARHTHANKDTLDKLGESGEILTYNGKKIVDETTLRVVSEYKQLIETKSDVMLVYVSKNRYGFTPLTLETGVIYGKESYGADKDTLYVDVELNNFFPCQPFVVVTENINHRDYNTHYEFATDGTSYFCYKRYQDEQMVYIHFFNNSDNSIEMDGFTFPSNGWSSCQYNFVIKEWGMVYKQIDDPALTSSNWGLSEGVKFSTNEHFTELENILSAQDPLGIYKGTYQSYNKKWVQVNFAQISINSNSVAESIGANAAAIESLQKQFAAFEGEVTEIEAMIDESGVLDE